MNSVFPISSSTIQTCRACLTPITVREDLYSFVSPGVKRLFSDCTSINVPVDNEDQLPKQICSKCYRHCKEWQSFKAMSILANQELEDKLLTKPIVVSDLSEDDSTMNTSVASENTTMKQELKPVLMAPTKRGIKCPVCKRILSKNMKLYRHLRDHVPDEVSAKEILNRIALF